MTRRGMDIETVFAALLALVALAFALALLAGPAWEVWR